MNINYNAIGLRIRNLRRQKFWTLEKLAEKAEIAPDYLCRIELGKKHPSLKTILLIADALDTTTDALLIDVQKNDLILDEKDEKFLFSGCTETQKRLIIMICQNIKNGIINYNEINNTGGN